MTSIRSGQPRIPNRQDPSPTHSPTHSPTQGTPQGTPQGTEGATPAERAAVADAIRCPGMSMLVRDGLDVDGQGNVKYQDLVASMQDKLGYSEGFAKFLVTVFANTSGTEGLSSTHRNAENQQLNVWDLGDARSGGQHVRSLPFRKEDGSVDLPLLQRSLDKHAPDGRVTLDAVADMINELGQSGIVADQPRGAGLKGRLGPLGEQQTAGEVMLLFAAFAKRGADGKVFMDRQTFETVYQGRLPDGFQAARDGHGFGTVPKWTGLTAKTGAKVVAGDVKAAAGDVWNAFASLFRGSDPVALGADVALGDRTDAGAGENVLNGVAKTGVCPAMTGGTRDVAPRNEAEAVSRHQEALS